MTIFQEHQDRYYPKTYQLSSGYAVFEKVWIKRLTEFSGKIYGYKYFRRDGLSVTRHWQLPVLNQDDLEALNHLLESTQKILIQSRVHTDVGFPVNVGSISINFGKRGYIESVIFFHNKYNEYRICLTGKRRYIFRNEKFTEKLRIPLLNELDLEIFIQMLVCGTTSLSQNKNSTLHKEVYNEKHYQDLVSSIYHSNDFLKLRGWLKTRQ